MFCGIEKAKRYRGDCSVFQSMRYGHAGGEAGSTRRLDQKTRKENASIGRRHILVGKRNAGDCHAIPLKGKAGEKNKAMGDNRSLHSQTH